MDKLSFQKKFVMKVVYNDDDLDDSRHYSRAVRNMVTFWNSMKKAGVISKALHPY